MVATDIVAVLTAVIGSVGGWEAIKYLLNRSYNKRKEEADADLTEFHVMSEINRGLQEQLKAKEERFVEQTDRLRAMTDRVLTLQMEKAQVELDLQKYKCIRKQCPNREPQNGY